MKLLLIMNVINRQKNEIFFTCVINIVSRFCLATINLTTVKRNEIISELDPDFPIRNILVRISDKWSLLLLYTLNKEQIIRFNALQKSIPDVAQKC